MICKNGECNFTNKKPLNPNTRIVFATKYAKEKANKLNKKEEVKKDETDRK
ncbi:MAG: hypothetical protein FWC36_06385 [Spirochaetes bacterium]|nr:hypothetical protein [Spirochaetota bacterium]